MIRTITLTILTSLLMSGCSWVDNYDRNKKYMEAESGPRVVVPEGLDEPDFVDMMSIPDVVDSRGIAGQSADLELPDALSTTFGVEQIVLKKLGDERWIFLDAPPAVIWPKLLQYWNSNNIEIETADPRQGILESVWVTAQAGTAADALESIISGTANTAGDLSELHKFKLTLEPGIRSGSSEVYLVQRHALPGGTSQPNWQGDSDNLEMENELLTKIAYYLGETINDPVISVMAIENRGEKAELIPDRIKPLLLYKLDFERAWATVGGALENARLEVADRDRTAQVYYVYYDETFDQSPGFLARFFDDETEASQVNRYLIRLDERPEAVQVSILKDETTPADALIAERLLKIIKESST
ncbi:MAG: outer membrane protein assembly factor BamC [Sulfitobacter sp.]